MSILDSVLEFFLFAVMAIAAQNVVFTRALGVSRLVYLVEAGDLAWSKFTLLLAGIQLLAAPMAFYANRWLGGLEALDITLLSAMRPLVMVLCSGIAFFIMLAVLGALASNFGMKDLREYARMLPMATFNCSVIGSLLLTTTGGYSLAQSLGFAAGSAVGYTAAILLVNEGQRKIQNRSVPASFKGLPVTLIYIGILALAIFGFTGHMPAI